MAMLISDLHSEEKETVFHDFERYLLPLNGAKLLILAGDIGTLDRSDLLIGFLTLAVKKYPNVIWVPGNHEYRIEKCPGKFSGCTSGTDTDLKRIADYINTLGYGKLHFLNCNALRLNINGTPFTFLGSTLWTNAGWNRERDRDYHLDPNIRQLFHLSHLSWLKHNLELNSEDIIVITHHPPLNLGRGEYGEYYGNDLQYLVNRVRCWIYGHLHDGHNLKSGECQLYCNSIGTLKENKIFRPCYIPLSGE